MKTYILIHTHDYGTTVYQFKTERTDVGEKDLEEIQQELIDLLSIDYEDNNLETLELHLLEEKEIATLN